MPPIRRNILVGIVVLVAMLLFAWLLVEFGGLFGRLLAPEQMAEYFDCIRADGISTGSGVYYLGFPVGHVTAVRLKPNGQGVGITAEVQSNIPIPSNVHAIIRTTQLLGGGATINLVADEGAPSSTPLPPMRMIATKYVGLQLEGLIPPELGNAAKSIDQIADELRQTIQTVNSEHVVEHIDSAIHDFDTQVNKAGQSLDSIQELVGDPQARTDLKTAAADIREFAESLKKISADASSTLQETRQTIAHTDQQVSDLSKQLGDRLQQLSTLMSTVQSISDKIDKSQGTAGMLVNDPKLYQSLVDSSRELNATVADLHRMIDQWEQEGVPLKLK